nr:MAG TPA: hypothetical protein [Caudoviricetes sp.]
MWKVSCILAMLRRGWFLSICFSLAAIFLKVSF